MLCLLNYRTTDPKYKKRKSCPRPLYLAMVILSACIFLLSNLYFAPRVDIPVQDSQLRSKAIETMISDAEEDMEDAVEDVEQSSDEYKEDAVENAEQSSDEDKEDAVEDAEQSSEEDVEDAVEDVEQSSEEDMEVTMKEEREEITREATAKEVATGVNLDRAINHEVDFSDRIFQRMWAKDPIIIKSHKLMFFQIPKNATSLFKKLFRRMMGFSDWFTTNPHTVNDLMYLSEFSREEQLEMMTSPEWTRAIFVRDPLERVLSAYLDKGLHGDRTTEYGVNGHYIKRHCCGMHQEGPNADLKNAEVCHTAPFTPFETHLNESNFPFEAFVDHVMKGCHDAHWLPQKTRIDKESNWDFINFVGKFENKMEDTHKMLKKIGAFEEFGKSGWGDGQALSIFEKNLALTNGHGTGSHNKMDKYYTPELKKRVYQHYKGDYDFKLFGFDNPMER